MYIFLSRKGSLFLLQISYLCAKAESSMPLFPVGTEIPDFYTKPQWFIGRVKYCHEHKAAAKLQEMDVEYFLPEQTVSRKWSDRVKKIKVLLLPRYIFIHCMNSKRVEILQNISSITNFMTDHDTHLAAVIRDKDLETFRLMVDYEDRPITIDSVNFSPGDRVRVICGPLMNHECELVEVSCRTCIAVGLGILGSARIELPLSYIGSIDDNNTTE